MPVFNFTESSLRIRATCMLLALFALAGPARSADAPKEMLGVWATAESEFEKDSLIGGVALYLLADGKAALVGAPLPVRRCADGRVCTPIIGSAGSASYEASSGRLTITLRDAQRSWTVSADYSAQEKVISLPETGKASRLVHRSDSVPKALEAAINGAPAR